MSRERLLALLTEWRASPLTELAEAIDDVSAKLAVAPLVGKTIVDRDAAFEVRAKSHDPIDLPVLLAHALERRSSAMVSGTPERRA
ncbi:MAG: hypothetical protein H0T79_08870 [Deltaproteobacteria bacterium]|nr:hypothetical protein [Deltaproteobacteria bacterium]